MTASAALRKLADYALPPELDRRLLNLDERAELMARVAFTRQRTAEKLRAEVAIRRLTAALPELAGQP